MPSKKLKQIESTEVLAERPAKTMAGVTAIAPPQKLKAPAKPRAKKKAVEIESANGLGHLSEAVAAETTGETVAMRAYFRWLERGCPAGSAEEDWLEAERELQHA